MLQRNSNRSNFWADISHSLHQLLYLQCFILKTTCLCCLMELFVLDVVCPLLLWYYICSSLPETSSSSHTGKNLPHFMSFCLPIIKHHKYKKGWHKTIFGLLKPTSQIYFLFHLTNHSNLLIVSPTAFRFYKHQITASSFSSVIWWKKSNKK